MTSLTENRRRAIERSGWGEDFRLVQPHNLAFWVYCLLVAAGAVVLSGQISIAAAAYSGALISGLIAFGLLAVAYLWFIHYEDRYTTVPRKLAAAGFVWGAVAAVGAFALLGNDAVMSLYAKGFGASFAYDWGAALTAPVNEELAKGAGVLLLLTLAPQLIRSPFDGLILGAFVGLGFQISEDISYAFIGAANAFGDVGAAWETIARSDARIDPFALDVQRRLRGRTDLVRRPARRPGAQGARRRPHADRDADARSLERERRDRGRQRPRLDRADERRGRAHRRLRLGLQEHRADRARVDARPHGPRGRARRRHAARAGRAGGVALGAAQLLRTQPRRRTAELVLEAETDLARQIARDGGAETAAVQRARAAVARAHGT